MAHPVAAVDASAVRVNVPEKLMITHIKNDNFEKLISAKIIFNRMNNILKCIKKIDSMN